MYQTVFFDLDGTLTDSGFGITNSVAYALKKWNIEETDRTVLNKFVGPPLEESFRKYYGFSPEQSQKSLSYYREYYTDKGIYENSVYEGILELLQALKKSGRKVVLATSKPEEFTMRVLKHFALDSYFDFVAGATMDGSRVEKADVIRHAIVQGAVSNLEEAVMVGDRENDILGARENGLSSIGVLYGYGSREELEKAGAGQIAETVEDLRRILGV